MTDGFIKSGAVKPADISVANPTAKKLEHFALQGASVTTDNKTAADGADIVIIAVKPWLVEQVVNELKPVLNYARQTVITVAKAVQEAVTAAVESACGVKVAAVNVNVCGIARK